MRELPEHVKQELDGIITREGAILCVMLMMDCSKDEADRYVRQYESELGVTVH